MSDNINAMNFKQLKNEVQLLRDELAIMKRKYEDAIYNLDSDNFSKSFTREQGNMKAQVKITAEAIKTMVSNTDLENALKNYSTITQTANDIELAVVAERNYVTNLLLDNYYTGEQVDSRITVSADNVISEVSMTYQTKNDANANYDVLQSRIKQNASGITSVVSKNISAYFESSLLPSKDATGEQKAMLCKYDNTYWYFNDIADEWLKYPAEGLETMFKQTDDGFEMTGNVKVTDIAYVANGLHIGSETDTEAKQLVFSEYAKLTAYPAGISANAGLYISANELKLGSRIVFAENTVIDFQNAKVEGLSSTVAVFG